MLIVEDEPQIRNGLLGLSLWQELGFEEAIGADDGEEALETVRSSPGVRVIVTDIRMEKMNGLELIRKLQDEVGFSGKVVILSGFDDFQYARQAMNYGVVDFLLKPVNIEELKRVVQKALAMQEREERRRMSLYLVEDAIPKLREELLQDLIERAPVPSAEEQILRQLTQYGIAWLGASRLILLVLEADNLKAFAQMGYTERELERVRFGIGNVLEHSLLEQAESVGDYVWLRSRPEGRWIVVFSAAEERNPGLIRWLREFKVQLVASLKQYMKASATIVISEAGVMASLPDLYGEACRKMTQAKIYGEEDEEADQETSRTFRDVDVLMEPRALAELLRHGDEQDVREAVSLFPDMVREWGVEKLRDLHHRVFDWLLDAFEEARKLGWKREDWKKRPLLVWEKIEALETSDTLQPLVLDYLLQANEELQGASASRNWIFEKAKTFIEERFRELITVQMVADHVYLSPEWLSTLFKKNAGMTFLDYLTHLRMEKAKELLQDVSLKIYQIGSEVGYRDTVYFSKLFKRKVGCTPNEYRKLKGLCEDE
ncbi:response regulator [Paenibacillus sp. LHD-117]|uniref:response regulator n=1 Tax=Paenibacillus sp. LHD-117 TaxID=3071412 RepID=UPI0027E03A11|nr:response regulator [Paenibacillus sp. LHD-117]MDQ6421463.1 response regulator [Paenibacillus sp. LHD-117]